ncbi:MAG: hypothetical protein HRU00_11335 [Myxococcales bacterium]|nr:hypothetical protein [Myxococcales bacterium]
MSGRIRLSRGLTAALVVLALGLLLAPGASLAGAKIEITNDSYITLGMGLRTDFASTEDAAPSGSDYSNDFTLDSWRLYIGGQIMPHVMFEFNADYGTDDNDLQVLDGVLKFEFDDVVNIWAGRFLPPSDRANLSGPYYLNAYQFPFVSQYPSIFAGRDDGAAYWGQIGGGMFKWQVGAFDGIEGCGTCDDNLLYAGRVVLNLWDPEPGYYNASTYYGEKQILAIGLAAQAQDDAFALGGDFDAWNVDVLVEKTFDFGVVSLQGAYYDYDRDGEGTVSNEGDAYFVLASILFPQEFGPGKWKGKFEPFVRYQEFDPDGCTACDAASDHERWDFGVNYVLRGHNARITAKYGRDRASLVDTSAKNIFLVGLQFQL